MFHLIGKAVVIPENRKEEAERRFSEQYFNVVANELMPINRAIPDARYPE